MIEKTYNYCYQDDNYYNFFRTRPRALVTSWQWLWIGDGRSLVFVHLVLLSRDVTAIGLLGVGQGSFKGNISAESLKVATSDSASGGSVVATIVLLLFGAGAAGSLRQPAAGASVDPIGAIVEPKIIE